MRWTHVYENLALLAFLLFLVGEVVAVSYVTFNLYVKANGWLLYMASLLPRGGGGGSAGGRGGGGGGNVTRFAAGNVSAAAAADGLRYFVEYPRDYRFVVDEPARCREQKPFVVVVVPVNPRNRAARDVIRATWGGEMSRGGRGLAATTSSSGKKKTLSLFFLLGLPTTAAEGEPDDGGEDDAERVQRRVLEESAEHGDLLQADFLDSYNNLTVKTMLMMEWLDSRCGGHAAYAAKVDTDVFVNARNLVDMLSPPRRGRHGAPPERDYMTGRVMRRSPVNRDPRSKWHVPRDVYARAHYPPYALGGFYVLSMDLPARLVEASRHVRPALYLEDVYVGLCMEWLGVALSEPPAPRSLLFPLTAPYGRCAYSRAVRAVVPPEELNATVRTRVWEDFTRPGPYCY